MGRWIGGVYGNTIGSDVEIASTTGVFTQNDFYYIKQEGGLIPPPDGTSSGNKVTTAADLAFHNQSNGSYYIDVHGTAFQITYENTVKFDSGIAAGVKGWVKVDNDWLGANYSNLSWDSYTTGNPLNAGWLNSGQGKFFIGEADQSNTGATGIGHVRFKMPKFKYACFHTMTCSGSGQQTPDDTSNWFSGHNSQIQTYAMSRNPDQANPGGYPIACYQVGATGCDSNTASTQGIVLPKLGNEFGNLASEVTKTYSAGDFAPVGFSEVASNYCWFACWTGDSGYEQIDFNDWELWIH